MENLPLILLVVLVALLVFAVLYLALKLSRQKPAPPPPSKPQPPREPGETETHELIVTIGEDNRWHVRTSAGDDGPLYVRRGDTVIWRIESTDAWFQFPLADIFHGGRTDDPWYYRIGDEGGELALTVSERACPGAHVYSVFCNVSKKSNIPVTGYAEGGSPPEMIIMQ